MSDKIKQPLIETFTRLFKKKFETFTCEICVEKRSLSHQFRHTNNCVHNICFMCIAGHIEAKLDENITTIHCPELNCGKILIPLECQPIIPPSLFVKWCDCLCRWCASAYSSCYCPYRDCSELILNECNEATTKCACPRCKRLICYACNVPWHAGFWCSETSQQRDANDVLFGALIERMKWRRCPKCGTPIELISGCVNVKCRCGTYFRHDGSQPIVDGEIVAGLVLILLLFFFIWMAVVCIT
ncbi:E3 ubiquitin-protein ligase RSL1-like [Salvia miltiorrhiza]|uniref:E3 ubiquitin-protein ligase RSL1-like n=1 Tax=Salvia miltiorrhiza TaxID=226208 RepID=UPI0025ACB782|nr:E3 ubiquitin-protein ligase RSL1-like [Salvia miltiorrhiza]